MNINICPICGNGQIYPRVDFEKIEYKGNEVFVPLLYSVCDVCGSEQASPEQVIDNANALREFRR